MEEFDTKKYRRLVKWGMPLLAVLFILLFIVLPVKFVNVAVRREAEAKDQPVKRIFEVDFLPWLN